jgi:type I restriction enzyme S subunit
MKKAALKDVAPAKAARLAFSPNDAVWQLNLDQIESQSGRILSKVTDLASTAGSSTQAFDTGNVLYSKLRPYLNKVVCPDSSGIATTELVPLRPDPKQLNRQYLTYYLRSPEFVKWVSNEVAGAKMPRVTMKVFWDHEIPLPPIDEQKRIAAILDAADALRAKRRQSIAQLDALIQSTFLDLFGDPVTNPMGWEVIPLGEICSLVNGRAFKPEEWESEGLPIIRIQNLNDDSKPFNYSSKKWPEKVRAKTNDILLSWSGTPGTSFGCFRWKGPEGWVNQHIFRVEVEPKIDSTFFIESVNARLLELISKAHGGVGLKHITKGKLETVELTLPPLPLQQKFAAIVESIERQKAAQRAHLAELDTLFAALQHRAFRGEL